MLKLAKSLRLQNVQNKKILTIKYKISDFKIRNI